MTAAADRSIAPAQSYGGEDRGQIRGKHGTRILNTASRRYSTCSPQAGFAQAARRARTMPE
jgi:hypothetical protein